MRVWEQIKNIFTAAKTVQQKKGIQDNCAPEPEEILLRHSVIERTAAELDYYKKWSASAAKGNFTQWLQEEYSAYRKSGRCDSALMFLMIPSMNGLIVRFDEGRWHEQDFICIFDFFKEQMSKKGNYWTQVSDIKTTQKGCETETVERHYLKPPRQFGLEYGAKKDQQFGNLMISLNIINNKISTLKLSATHYNDHQFEKALSFDDLMQLLCS